MFAGEKLEFRLINNIARPLPNPPPLRVLTHPAGEGVNRRDDWHGGFIFVRLLQTFGAGCLFSFRLLAGIVAVFRFPGSVV